MTQQNLTGPVRIPGGPDPSAVALFSVTIVWATAIWASQHIHPAPVLHDAALLLHLASLVAGFGAVLTLDWFGARWLLGRESTEDLIRLVAGVEGLIWLGLAGLVLSGVFLQPDLHDGRTQVKLAAVLVVAVNGIQVHALRTLIAEATVIDLPLLRRIAVGGLISQVGWWTALLIGHLNAR